MCYIGNLDPDSLMYFVIIPQTFYLLAGTVALFFGFSYLFKIRKIIKHQSGRQTANLEKLMLKLGMFSILYAIPVACVVGVNFYYYTEYSSWLREANIKNCYNYKIPGNKEQKMAKPNQYSTDLRNYRHRETYVDSSSVSRISEYYTYDNIDVKDKKTSNSELYRERRTINLINDQDESIHSIQKFKQCTLKDSIPQIELLMLKIFMCLFSGIVCGMWVWSEKTIQSWSQFCNCR